MKVGWAAGIVGGVKIERGVGVGQLGLGGGVYQTRSRVRREDGEEIFF